MTSSVLYVPASRTSASVPIRSSRSVPYTAPPLLAVGPVEDHLSCLPGAGCLERPLEVGGGEAVRDHGRDVEPGLQHHRHLVPGLVHLAAIDPLHRQHVEDD